MDRLKENIERKEEKTSENIVCIVTGINYY
jgi:hypothetical protein